MTCSSEHVMWRLVSLLGQFSPTVKSQETFENGQSIALGEHYHDNDNWVVTASPLVRLKSNF